MQKIWLSLKDNMFLYSQTDLQTRYDTNVLNRGEKASKKQTKWYNYIRISHAFSMKISCYFYQQGQQKEEYLTIKT